MNSKSGVIVSFFALLALTTPCVMTGKSTPLALQGNLTVWPSVERGGKFQVTGYQPFLIRWLYNADPCSRPLVYKTAKSVTTASCKIKKDAEDNYVFQVDPEQSSSASLGDVTYMRVVPCKGCLSIPPKKGPTQPTKKPTKAKANLTSFTVNVWCDKGTTTTDPDPIKAPSWRFSAVGSDRVE